MSISNLFFPNDYRLYSDSYFATTVDAPNSSELDIGFKSSTVHIGNTGPNQIYINQLKFPQDYTTGTSGITGATGHIGPGGIHGVGGVTGSTGHRGLNGFPGYAGATGATGPDGPTGASNNLVAYGSAINISSAGDITLNSNSDMVFAAGAGVSPHNNITPPPNGGQYFGITLTGKYFFNLYLVGQPVSTNVPLVFGITVNGSAPQTEYEFVGNFCTSGASIYECIGHGIINLNAGDLVGIRNRTGSGGTSVLFAQSVYSGDTEVVTNVKLTLMKIA